jgi:hypothetical protein
MYLQKSTIYIYAYTSTYPLSGAHTFNTAWTTLHMLQERIHVLRKWPQNIHMSLGALGTRS